MIFLDTHVVVWAYQGDAHLLSKKVVGLIEANDIYISPMVVLELQYLYEIKRAKIRAQAVVDSLQRSIGLSVHECSFEKIVQHSLSSNWTRDPFDRLITAHATALDATLLTKDETIHKFYKKAVF
jgi:PIN domain nuclease of toxin-antitoxin system